MGCKSASKYYQPTCADVSAGAVGIEFGGSYPKSFPRYSRNYIAQNFYKSVMIKQLLPGLTWEQQLQSYELRASFIGDGCGNTGNPFTNIFPTQS
jgi:hypothetical protein